MLFGYSQEMFNRMNFQTSSGFRCLVVLSVLADISAIFVDMVFPSLLPVQWQYDLISASENLPPWMQEHAFLSIAVLGSLVLAWMGGFAGLLFFKRWGRALSLYLTFVRMGLGIWLAEPSYSSGVSFALALIGATLWGFVLALSYYSAVAQRFTRL
jgi:hypothetical protein